ncbi:MAG: FAD-dependent oxidoreductase [Thermoleophilia bacterium]|nr:FAD-dependent oxidoreductase [Thermoleophilia bacterium]
MERVDAVVLGAGPSGLGAGLALARGGATVVVMEAARRVGGLCVTRRANGFAYDVGGHIPFVRSEARRAWLEEVLAGELHWVDRPVSCVIDGAIAKGRYLDQRPSAPLEAGAHDETALGELGSRFGQSFVDEAMRPYLEKIDGVPLERIPGSRAIKLMVDQAAPEGFWFPNEGIGQLMDAMADAISQAGGEVALCHQARAIEVSAGRVTGVAADSLSDLRRIATDSIVVGIPAGLAARLVQPAAPAAATPHVAMRAVCLVYLAIDQPAVTHEAWIQVDHPEVPFSRAFEPRNWSERLSPPNETMLGLECYCQADPDDPVWALDDEKLARACAAAAADPLGWIDSPARASLIEVVRMPRAYPVPDLRQVSQISAPVQWLGQIDGIHVAPGAAVIEAIEAGERAAARLTGAAHVAV